MVVEVDTEAMMTSMVQPTLLSNMLEILAIPTCSQM